MSQTILTEGLGYEGKVTLTLKSNNRVLQSKTYKNNGTIHLFNFLGRCLVDSFEEAKRLLPQKIMLLYNSSTSPVGADPTSIEQRSGWQPLVQTPTLNSDNQTTQIRVIYNFEVPKNSITGPFNQVALYGAGMTSQDVKDFSAYYFLTDEFGAFDSQNPAIWSATTVLLIEWELIISNQNTVINNRAKEDN